MADQAEIPPIIARRRQPMPAIVLGIVLLCAAAARLAMDFQIPFPRCTFKATTGLPCAFCGGTRSLRALTHLDFGQAFALNPLITLAAAGTALYFLFWLIAPAPAFQRWTQSLQRLPLLPIGLTLLALNWIFLLLFLPR